MSEMNVPEPGTLQKVIDGTESLNVFFGFDQNTLDALAALAFNLYGQGKVRDAETLFRGLVALDSKQYYGWAGLGAVALAEEKADEAVPYLKKAIELNPNDPTIHANLGEALLRQANFQEAAKLFDKALDLDPKGVDPGANRARAILTGMEILVTEMKCIANVPSA
jgi:tetratricopeptide (TPR) repeat protein